VYAAFANGTAASADQGNTWNGDENMKRTKTFLVGLCVGLMVLGMAASASALLITPATTPQLTGSQTSNAAIEAYLDTVIGNFDPNELFSAEATGSNTNIEWNAPAYIDTLYLVVKDGNHNPAIPGGASKINSPSGMRVKM